jgi:hypothetical protein
MQIKTGSNHRIITLDIEGLYINVPIKDILHIMEGRVNLNNRN